MHFRTILLALFCLVPILGAAEKPASQPNILFILADDLGWADTTPYGTSFYETPNIARLAGRGVKFTNCHTSSPVCSPSRASILTGLYAERLGMTQPAGHIAEVRLSASLPERAQPDHKLLQPQSVTRLDTIYPTLSRSLQSAGYLTGHFGKWHLGAEPYSPFQHGFNVDIPHWSGHGPNTTYFGPKNYGEHFVTTEGEHIEERMTQEAVRFIEQNKERPFFLNYWAFSVHSPFFAKPELIEKYRRKAASLPPECKQRNPVFAAMIETFDHSVGALLDALEKNGLSENTIVVFTSDNGGLDLPGYTGEKAWGNGTPAELREIPITSNAPLAGGKGSIHDGGTAVPLIISWPGKTQPGSRSDAFFSGTDFYPTLLEMTGTPLPSHAKIDGISQVPALLGKGAPRNALYGFWPNYSSKKESRPAAWVREGDFKLVRYFSGGEEQTDQFALFNLRMDRGESRDLAATLPQEVARLRRLLQAHLIETQAVLPAPNPAYRLPKKSAVTPSSAVEPTAALSAVPPVGVPTTSSFVVSHGQTIVATVVATEAPFDADPTGNTDASAAIQKALDVVGSGGGGVVFLPAGQYRLDSGLRIGRGTTLRGEKGGGKAATILLAYAGHGTESAPPLVQIPGGLESGVIGVTIYYPRQEPESIVAYPFAIAGGGASTIRDVTLCNAYNGIDLPMVNACVVEGIRGTVLRRGITAVRSTEFSWIRDVSFTIGAWSQMREALGQPALRPEQLSAIRTFTRSHLIGLELGRLDGLALDGFSVESAQLPVLVQKRPHPEDDSRVFGLGGVVYRMQRPCHEQDWDAWYYRMHYADLDKVPELDGRQYEFSEVPIPSRTEPESFLDVTAAPFHAFGDGKKDDTEAIRGALQVAAARGGGTVFLPRGEYRVTQPLVIPEGVELRGSHGQGRARQHAEFCTLAGDLPPCSNPETAPALLTLKSGAGVRGMAIAFPKQSYDPLSLVPFPYAIRGAGCGIWIVETHLLNALYGIDLASARCDRHLVRDVWGSAVYRGLRVGAGSRDGRLERVAFSFGPWAEAGRFRDVRTSESKERLAEYLFENSVHYTFGDCVGEKTWGLVGFKPRIHFQFVSEDNEFCRESEFWLTMHDVAKETCLKFEAGGSMDLFGFFGTGSGQQTFNWFEMDPKFQGPLRVHGETIEPKFINHALHVRPDQVRFFGERSLTEKATVTASASQTDPGKAVDRDRATWWEAPAGSVLDADLGSAHFLNRVRLESAGFLTGLENNSEKAELLLSMDGEHFKSAAILYLRSGGAKQRHADSWGDIPLFPPIQARYARLRVMDSGQIIRVAGFHLFEADPSALTFAHPASFLIELSDSAHQTENGKAAAQPPSGPGVAAP
jgi:arylsulfatase A-like enzyme